MGWTGDTQVFSATASYLADTYAFYRKYLYDMYQEQLLADGMVPEIVPTFGPSKCSCAWGDAACIIPWNVYLFSGDKTILESQIESMKAWVDYIRRIDGDHHGWRQIFHYGDWLALDRTGAAANSVYGATDEAYIADIYYAASPDSRKGGGRAWTGRNETGISGNRRPSVAGSERRIFYFHRKMCGEDADRAYPCAEVSSV